MGISLSLGVGKKVTGMAMEHPRESVYRIRAKYHGRRLPWRVVDVLDRMPLGAFDHFLRQLFFHDQEDKLSAFFRGGRMVYAVDPWERSDPVTVGLLFQRPGERLEWVFDLDNRAPHQLILTGVLDPEPSASYPLVVRQSHPEYRTCGCGVTPATWFCDSCSEQQGMLVALCDECMGREHFSHRTSRIVY